MIIATINQEDGGGGGGSHCARGPWHSLNVIVRVELLQSTQILSWLSHSLDALVFVSLRFVVFVVQSRTVCHVEPFRQVSGDRHS